MFSIIHFILEHGRAFREKIAEANSVLKKEKKETLHYVKNHLVRETNLQKAKDAKDKAIDSILDFNLRKTKGFISRLSQKIPPAWKRHIPITAAIIFIAIFFYNENYPESYTLILYGVYLVLTFTLKIDSRIPIAAALILLIITPFYLIKNLESYANFIAILAYYFLVVGVIKQFVEYIRESKSQTEKMDEVFGEKD